MRTFQLLCSQNAVALIQRCVPLLGLPLLKLEIFDILMY
jgi:hypothetical protein